MHLSLGAHLICVGLEVVLIFHLVGRLLRRMAVLQVRFEDGLGPGARAGLVRHLLLHLSVPQRDLG
jgi:hypothetical protein